MCLGRLATELCSGTGRIRVGEELHTLQSLASVLVDPDAIRQPLQAAVDG